MDYEKIAEGIEIPGLDEHSSQARPIPHQFLPLNHEKYQGIAAAKGYAQGEEFSGNRLQKVRYTHEAMIDVILAEPTITQKELAARFEKTQAWISCVMGSDAFQAALAKRRDDVTNPYLVATIEERLRGVVDQSLQVVAEKLSMAPTLDQALEVLKVGSKALGYGARERGGSVTNNNFVVALPPKIENAADWVTAHTKDANPTLIEGTKNA